MPDKSPLKLRELLKRLKKHGVVSMKKKRGKGSEIILVKPIEKGSKKGPQYPIKNHGENTEINHQVISAVLRRFDINPEDFW